MKTQLFSLLAAATLFASCQNAPEADEAKVGEAQEVSAAAGETYNADLVQSNVQFTGTKPVGQHQGQFSIKEGNLVVNGENITGGRFVIDVASMKITDKDTNGVSMLSGHLQSGDFFDVQKYPTATFEITSVTAGAPADEKAVMKDATHTISGNLTLKDTTRSITFPAKVQMANGQVTADANFNIDRTQWKMVYGNDQSLGDKFIRPEVNIVLHLVAKK
jgi:polyisoprenoid-binding protein YceI